MLSSTRSRLCLFAAQSSRYAQRATYTSTVPRLSENTIPTNNPNPQKPVTSISETNAREPASMQETVEQAQKQLSMQAPNRATTWAKNQQERSKAMAGPRFEQTIIDFQVSQLIMGVFRGCIWNNEEILCQLGTLHVVLMNCGLIGDKTYSLNLMPPSI